MVKKASGGLAAAKARVSRLEAADKKRKAVDAAKSLVKKAQAQLKAARGSGKKG